MSSYFIGLDIGTTSTKAVAFSATGHVVAQHSIGYPILRPQRDHSEQDPDEIVDAVIATIREVQAKAQPFGTLQGISFSAAMHSLMAVDAQGQPLTQVIIWADNRASHLADILKATKEGMAIYHTTGTPIHAMTPLCKLRWLSEHEPELFRKAHKFIGIKEYIFLQIFGEYVVDYSVASATGLLDIHTLNWSEPALHTARVTPAKLSTLVPIFHTQICPDVWAEKLAIPAQTPFVIGANDGCLANVGSGAITPDRISVTIGTSAAVRIGIAQPWTDVQMRTFCYVLTHDLFIAGGGMNNGGIIAEWLYTNLFPEPGGNDFARLFNQAQTVSPGSEGLLFLPYLLGERAPVYNAHAKGMYFGITIRHTSAHFIRATLEGIALAVYHTGKALVDQLPDIETLYVGGGFARSEFWVQLLADVYGKKVVITETVESSAYGAVLVGWQALGILDSWSQAPALTQTAQTFEPDASRHALYQQQFKKYVRLYEAVKPEFFYGEDDGTE